MEYFMAALTAFVPLMIVRMVFDYRLRVKGIEYGRIVGAYCWAMDKCAVLLMVAILLIVLASPFFTDGSCNP